MSNNWPGNIRELKWAIHRAVAIASKEMVGIDEISVSSGISGAAKGIDIDHSLTFHEAMEDIEKRYIKDALLVSNNNKTEAARILGISLRVLHYKVKKYHL